MIANEITRLQQAKENIKAAIRSKGGQVADTDKIDTFATKIENLPDSEEAYNQGYQDRDQLVIKEIQTITQNGGYSWANGIESIEVKVQGGGNIKNLLEGTLTEYTVPDSVTKIGKGVFAYTDLKSITLPDSVTRLEVNSFTYAVSLNTINHGELQYIGKTAFKGSGTVTYDNCKYIGDILCEKSSSKATYNIKEGTAYISGDAFASNSSLTSIEIPEGVKLIGDRAFYNCSKLASVTLPSTLKYINGEAFSSDSVLSSINIPDSVVEIGASAFSGCKALNNITIPNLNALPTGIFYNCTGLTSVTIPNSVTKIGANAFWGCSGLKYIEIPNSVTSIGDGAFASGVEAIFNFGNTRTSIVSISSTSAFQYYSTAVKFIVPDALYTQWQTASVWSQMKAKIVSYSDAVNQGIIS